MPLNEKELLYVYHDLHHIFREDLHLARPLIQMYQKQGNDEQARQLAMAMARRMLAGGRPSHALGFLELCKRLNHPQIDSIESMISMAQMTMHSKHEQANHDFTLIERLSDREALNFIKTASLVHCKEGQNIVEQNQISDNFYLILEGKISVHIHTEDHQEIALTTLNEGAYFGEYACIYELPRSATVTSLGTSVLLEFTKHSVSALMQQSPEAGEQLVQVVQNRMIQSLARTHPAFSDLADGDRDWLAEESSIIELQDDNNVESTLKEHCCIVMHGHLDAISQVNGQSVHCNLETHAIFSDLHKHLKLPEKTQLIAHERCLICCIPAPVFQSFLKAYGSFEHWLKSHGQQHCHTLKA
ncbi:MAG: cyclic nucleotide-binding domain-containing protein [Mariprofundaceae bacterium]